MSQDEFKSKNDAHKNKGLVQRCAGLLAIYSGHEWEKPLFLRPTIWKKWNCFVAGLECCLVVILLRLVRNRLS